MEALDLGLSSARLRERLWACIEERLPAPVLVTAHAAIARTIDANLAGLEEWLACGGVSVAMAAELAAAGEAVSEVMAWSLIDEVVVCMAEVVVGEADARGGVEPGVATRATLEVSNHFFNGFWVFEGKVAVEQAVRFGRLAERLPTPVFMANGDGRITFANPALRDTLGVPAGDLVGRSLEEVFGLGLAAADGSDVDIEIERGGVIRHLRVKLLAVPGEAEVEFFGSVLDRTHEMELEATKRQVVATISHELRTPLTAVLGYLELLREGKRAGLTDAERDQALETMHGEADLLLRMVHDLVDFAHLETGNITLEPELFLLEDAVQAAVRRTFGDGAGRPAVDVAAGLKLRADRARIEQLFTNLLNNAFRYGGDNVAVDAWRDGDDVQFRVSDDGAGIDIERRERIFDIFYQGHDLLGVGAGIGLAVCRAVAHAHGGTITLEDRPGASFLVTLAGAGV